MGISVLTVLERVGRPVGPGANLVVVPRGGRLTDEEDPLVEDWVFVLVPVGVVCVGRCVELDCVVLAVVVGAVGDVPVLVLVFVLVFCANAPLESREMAKTAEKSSERFDERRDDPIVTVDIAYSRQGEVARRTEREVRGKRCRVVWLAGWPAAGCVVLRGRLGRPAGDRVSRNRRQRLVRGGPRWFKTMTNERLRRASQE